MGFPHSEISGSKVARHLPEAYRSYATSFIASYSQGIHHMLLNFLLGNLKTTIITYNFSCPAPVPKRPFLIKGVLCRELIFQIAVDRYVALLALKQKTAF